MWMYNIHVVINNEIHPYSIPNLKKITFIVYIHGLCKWALIPEEIWKFFFLSQGLSQISIIILDEG